MSRVFVVMSNDYPDAVFDDKLSAETYCEEENAADKLEVAGPNPRGRIFYRVYTFELNQPGRIWD